MSVSLKLPTNWGVNCSYSIDDALVAKRCKSVVREVSAAVHCFADQVVSKDNTADDYCPDANRVIALGLSNETRGRCPSNVDMSFSDDKSQVLNAEVRSKNESYRAVSKMEQNGDSVIFSRQIEMADPNDSTLFNTEEDVRVQVNADGTLTMLQDNGQVPANMDYYVKAVHCQET